MTKAPEKIYGWMDTQLSVSRHYGGCTYQGHSYTVDYNDIDRPLVRSDVFVAEKKAKKAKGKTQKPEVQLDLTL